MEHWWLIHFPFKAQPDLNIWLYQIKISPASLSWIWCSCLFFLFSSIFIYFFFIFLSFFIFFVGMEPISIHWPVILALFLYLGFPSSVIRDLSIFVLLVWNLIHFFSLSNILPFFFFFQFRISYPSCFGVSKNVCAIIANFFFLLHMGSKSSKINNL